MRTRTLGTDPVYKPKGLRSDCSTSVLANLNHSNTRGWRVPLGNWTWNFPKESSWENFTSSCPTELSNLDHNLDDWIFIYRNRYIEIEKTLRIIYTSFLFSYYWNLCSFCFYYHFCHCKNEHIHIYLALGRGKLAQLNLHLRCMVSILSRNSLITKFQPNKHFRFTETLR